VAGATVVHGNTVPSIDRCCSDVEESEPSLAIAVNYVDDWNRQRARLDATLVSLGGDEPANLAAAAVAAALADDDEEERRDPEASRRREQGQAAWGVPRGEL
jgi:hypothetical protein